MVRFVDELDGDLVPFATLHARVDGSYIFITKYAINPFWPFRIYIGLVLFSLEATSKEVELVLPLIYFRRGLPWKSVIIPGL